MTTGDNLPDKDYDKSLGSVVGIEDVDYEALKQLNLHHGATFQDADGGQRGSFHHVSFQRSTFDFDDKYNMQGRFAFSVDELPIPRHGDYLSHPEAHLKKTSVYPQESPLEDNVNTG